MPAPGPYRTATRAASRPATRHRAAVRRRAAGVGRAGEHAGRRQRRPAARRTAARRAGARPGAADSASATGFELGTSSWSFLPGWQGLVLGRAYAEAVLAAGLTAYHRHPLLRTVSLDRAFYRPLEDAATYAGLAAQVPAGFRFVVNAPALVTDAVLRDAASGQALRGNPLFLDPRHAVADALAPAVAGLGAALGVLVSSCRPCRPNGGWMKRATAVGARPAVRRGDVQRGEPGRHSRGPRVRRWPVGWSCATPS